MSANADKIRAALGGGAHHTLKALAQLTGIKRSTISGWLWYAEQRGEIRRFPGNPKGPAAYGLAAQQPANISPRNRQTIETTPGSPRLALPPATELRCAIFHDATIVIDKAGVAMTLEPHECERLDNFLEQQSPIWQERLKTMRRVKR